MEFGYWVLVAMGCGVIVSCFVRILMKVAQNKNTDAGFSYKKYRVKGKYKSEPTLA